ncbi:MAG: site-specific integrase [Eggerthellaceae bacterium]|nr:site-specific integrase [Eggerthellaceae bacterium]
MARTKQREVYGNGSVCPERRNGETVRDSWRVCIDLGKDSKGKRRRITRIVHGSLAEARKVCKGLVTQYEHVNMEAAQGTFASVCSAWLDMMRNANVASADVIRQYQTWLGYMAEYLGQARIVEINKADVERAMTNVKAARGLSNTTMNKLFAVTKRLFAYAVDSDMAVRNPCSKITPPRKDEVTTRKSLSVEEAALLRSILDRDEAAAYGDFEGKEARQAQHDNLFGRSCVRGLSGISGIVAIRLMLATGMRRGEACGLTWGAVSFEDGQICIKQSLTAHVDVKAPKTKAGIRTLHVDADTMNHLSKWKDFQAKALHMVMPYGSALTQTDETPVIISDIGGWLDPTNLSRWWGKYRKSIGFPTLKMHELRHTAATLLLGFGADVKTVQRRLGHSRASMTLDQYAHAIPANDQEAADLLGALLSQTPKSARVLNLNKTA